MQRSVIRILSATIDSYDQVIKRSHFPQVNSLEPEINKAACLRILLGIIVFIRYAEITHTLMILDQNTDLVLIACALLLCIVAFTVGFLTPISSLILLSSLIIADRQFGTTTLGTSILVVTILPLFLINAGQQYSVDKILFRQQGSLKKLITLVYSIIPTTTKEDVTRAYFLSFLLYAVMSFGALALHIHDSNWTGGLTVKSLLTNSYLCKYSSWFIYLDQEFPLILSTLSVSAGIFQSIFQFLMIPLIFSKFGRKFVFYWGLNFFLISLFFINLSYLPHIEIILWILIMYPAQKLSSDHVASSQLITSENGRPSYLSSTVHALYSVLILAYILFEFPYIRKFAPTSSKSVYTALDIAGFDMPNVFNAVDLSMGNHWIEMYRREGEEWKLVPLNGTSGERLNHLGFDILNFTNHNSDLLYFGTTLAFRRGVMGYNLNDFFRTQYGLNNLVRRIRYDYRLNQLKEESLYLVQVYVTSASKVSHESTNPERFKKRLAFESTFSYDGTNLRKM